MDPRGKLQALSKWGVILSALGPYLTWDLQPSVREHIHHCRCCQNSIKWWQDWSRSRRWNVSGCCCSWHVNHSPCQVCDMLCNTWKFVLFLGEVLRLRYRLFWLYVNKTRKGERAISLSQMHLELDLERWLSHCFSDVVDLQRQLLRSLGFLKARGAVTQNAAVRGHCG